jgi:hypothetical protein
VISLTKVKKDEKSRESGLNEREEKCIKILVEISGNLKRRHEFEDLVVDGRIFLCSIRSHLPEYTVTYSVGAEFMFNSFRTM